MCHVFTTTAKTEIDGFQESETKSVMLIHLLVLTFS